MTAGVYYTEIEVSKKQQKLQQRLQNGGRLLVYRHMQDNGTRNVFLTSYRIVKKTILCTYVFFAVFFF